MSELHSRAESVHVRPGRYAAIDVGTNSVLLLVAEIGPDASLHPLMERSRITRLGQNVALTGQLSDAAIGRTLRTVEEYVALARESDVGCVAVVGTAVLRDAVNAARFSNLVRARCGVMVEVITGEQEAELAWRAQGRDPALGPAEDPRVVLDIGGGSTEVVSGTSAGVSSRASYQLGAVRVTEHCLKHDPPTMSELDSADQMIEAELSPLEPVPAGAQLVGTGGTITNLGAVARAAGLICSPSTHGARLPHTRVAELVDLFRSMPIRFRQRVPELEPDRADIILGGAMILHQAMAKLAAPEITVSTNGIRHGCVVALAERSYSLIGA